jgi:beta-galactosidase
MLDEGIFYWYGENKDTTTSFPGLRTEVIGISCYSSRDLMNWEYHGVVLPAEKKDTSHAMHTSKVAERPKVVYNERTGKYVMWLHIDNARYLKAHVGVAVADHPTGPFRFIDSFRPLGFQSRDMTVFKDDDGKGFLIYGSGWHDKIVIAEMSEDYLSLSGTYTTHLHTSGPPQGREAPAMFKRKGKYYLITSGTTGWFTNPARYDVAEDIHGPYTNLGNPCVGMYADQTFIAQSTYVLKVEGIADAYMFMADRWIPTDLKNSRYIWLPIQFTSGDSLEIRWTDGWNPNQYWN